MNALLVLAVALQVVCTRQDARIEEGFFSFYEQAPTDATIAYHQQQSQKLPHDLSDYAGAVAYAADCSTVGRDAWLQLTDERLYASYRSEWLKVIIFDCGGHQESIDNFFKANNIIGELDFYLAEASGAYALQGGVAGNFSFDDPRSPCSELQKFVGYDKPADSLAARADRASFAVFMLALMFVYMRSYALKSNRMPLERMLEKRK